MGGYGSGGLNKSHESVESYRYSKIDSFAFYEFLKGDKYLHYKTEIKYPIVGDGIIYHVKTKTASLDIASGCYPLGLSRVPNIDGRTMRMYFLCPECEKRVRFLYRKDGGYICRKCAKLNYGCQQKSGREEVLHKMRCIVENKLQYPYWKNENPNILLPDLVYIPKPQYMRWEKYNRLIKEYNELREQYWSMEVKDLSRYCDIYNLIL